MNDDNDEIERWKWLCSTGARYLLEGQYTFGNTKTLPNLNDWQNSMLKEQVAFQPRCARRFPNAPRWLWTDKTLAQASDSQSATFKASLFPHGSPIIDGCCGAGADTVALSHRGPTTGVDLDPINLQIAAFNTAHNGAAPDAPSVTFACDRIPAALTTLADENTWLHLDPDRRHGGTKSTYEDDFSPSIQELLPAVARAQGALIKISPSTDFAEGTESQLSQIAQRLWIGVGSECRQQVLLFGEAKTKLTELLRNQLHSSSGVGADRFAVLLPSMFANKRSEPAIIDSTSEPSLSQPLVALGYFAGEGTDSESIGDVAVSEGAEPGDVIFDLHATLHASDLAVAWASQNELSALGDVQGYFHAREPLSETSWTQQFRILDVESWDDRKIRKRLRALKPGSVEVKARRFKIDANHFQRRYQNLLATEDGPSITLLVTRIGQRVRCFICERLA